VRVLDVLFAATEPAQRGADPDNAFDIPAVEAGDVLLVGAVRRDEASESDHRLGEESDRGMLGVTYFPADRIRGYRSGWVLDYVASVETDGSWTFQNAVHGDYWDAQLAELAEHLAATSATQLMVGWSQEAAARRPGEPDGPITSAYIAINGSGDAPGG
jgi:hypothetical protein